MDIPDAQVVAVCDVDSWRLEEARKLIDGRYGKLKGQDSYKSCAAYRDFREVLARQDIDAVMISTPDH